MSHTLTSLRQAVKDKFLGRGTLWGSDDGLDAAINRAVVASYPDWYVLKTATISGTADTFEYTIATDAKNILRVLKKEADDAYYPLTDWEVRPADAGGSTNKLHFHVDHSAETLSYEYLASPATMSAATDSTTVHPEFIMAYVGADILWGLAQQDSDPDSRALLIEERNFQRREVAECRRTYGMRRPAMTRKAHPLRR